MNRNTGKISRTVKAKNDQHSKNSASKERNTGKVSTDSDSEGPLSITFTIYTQNFVPTYARGGPASHFSQFSELCVSTSKYISTWVPDYPTYTYRSLSWSALIYPPGVFVLLTKGVDSLCLASIPFPGLSLTQPFFTLSETI